MSVTYQGESAFLVMKVLINLGCFVGDGPARDVLIDCFTNYYTMSVTERFLSNTPRTSAPQDTMIIMCNYLTTRSRSITGVARLHTTYAPVRAPTHMRPRVNTRHDVLRLLPPSGRHTHAHASAPMCRQANAYAPVHTPTRAHAPTPGMPPPLALPPSDACADTPMPTPPRTR